MVESQCTLQTCSTPASSCNTGHHVDFKSISLMTQNFTQLNHQSIMFLMFLQRSNLLSFDCLLFSSLFIPALFALCCFIYPASVVFDLVSTLKTHMLKTVLKSCTFLRKNICQVVTSFCLLWQVTKKAHQVKDKGKDKLHCSLREIRLEPQHHTRLHSQVSRPSDSWMSTVQQ